MCVLAVKFCPRPRAVLKKVRAERKKNEGKNTEKVNCVEEEENKKKSRRNEKKVSR